MTTILHIQASPRPRSASREVAEAFLERYAQRHPNAQVETLDLWQYPLPEFGQDAMAAKYAGLAGTPLSHAQALAWQTLQALAEKLKRAEVLVFSIPLWNFGIPYKLKHFIDLVSQKDILFEFDAERGFSGLLRDKQVLAIYARGLDYSADSATPDRQFDFQRRYFEAWLSFVGVQSSEAIMVEKTILGDAPDRHARDQACQRARELAEHL